MTDCILDFGSICKGWQDDVQESSEHKMQSNGERAVKAETSRAIRSELGIFSTTQHLSKFHCSEFLVSVVLSSRS